MSTLGTAIAESVLLHYGRPALLSRLSDPFWFQALGIGDGDGLALLRHHHVGHGGAEDEASIRGRTSSASTSAADAASSRATHPASCARSPSASRLDGDALVRTSRLTARVDNNAVADGFQIYLHSFILTRDGDWAVVQQGMNEASRLARRYHWHSATVRDFTSAPHTAIVGEHAGTIMNLVDRDGAPGPGRAARHHA